MRTTLTLDEGVAVRLRRLAATRNATFKATVNEALKRGMDVMTVPPVATEYSTEPRRLGTFVGIDPSRLGQLDAEVDDRKRMGQG